jgi:hypothetical protein
LTLADQLLGSHLSRLTGKPSFFNVYGRIWLRRYGRTEFRSGLN